jgi:hypothetical protein
MGGGKLHCLLLNYSNRRRRTTKNLISGRFFFRTRAMQMRSLAGSNRALSTVNDLRSLEDWHIDRLREIRLRAWPPEARQMIVRPNWNECMRNPRIEAS